MEDVIAVLEVESFGSWRGKKRRFRRSEWIYVLDCIN